MTVPQSIQEQLQLLNPSAIIELFQLELTELVNGIDLTLYYHAGKNDLTNDIVFGGTTYSAYPIEVDGFELTSKGTLPRPTMRVSNIAGSITQILLLYKVLNAKLTRIRTCKKFLDGVNFTGGTNPTADPTAKFTDEVWYVDRVSSENPTTVELELTSKLDLINLALPRRQVLEHCPWKYRGVECGYTGSVYFDINDNPVTNSAQDVCGKRYNSCAKRFTSGNLPFGGFPGARLQI
jgi:lambda family phage minor tail protein L